MHKLLRYALPLLAVAVASPVAASTIVAFTETIALTPPDGTLLYGNTWAEGGLTTVFKSTVTGIALEEGIPNGPPTPDHPEYFFEIGELGGPYTMVGDGTWTVDSPGNWLRIATFEIQVFYDPVYAADNAFSSNGFITYNGTLVEGPFELFAHADQSDHGNRIVAFGAYEIAQVPEPSTWALLAFAGMLVGVGRRIL